MTIDEILAAMPEPAAEGDHDYLVIDPATRTIAVPDSERIFGVTGDELAERKYFLCPRYVGDGLDLAGMFLTVYFRNANGEPDGYAVTDVAVNGDYITFSWELKEKVTKYMGKVQFSVCADLPNTDQVRRPDWNTTNATGEVLEGLHPDIADVTEESSDLATQLRAQIAASTAAVEACGAEQIQKVKTEGNAQVNAVKATGAQTEADVLAAIKAQGEATLATIPAEYSVLAAQVDTLTRDRAAAIVCRAEGELLQITDASDDPLHGLRIFGRTEQVKTTGKQLLPIVEDNTKTDRGLTQVVVGGVCIVRGTANSTAAFNLTLYGSYYNTEPVFTLQPGTYTVKDCMIVSSDGTTQKKYENTTFTLTEALGVTWVATRSYQPGEVVAETTYPMIHAGNAVLPWEPYSGGMASPCPAWPQELQSAQAAAVGVCGKNLIPNIKSKTSGGITFTANSDGSFTVNGTADAYRNGDSDPIDATPYRGRTVTLSGKHTFGNGLALQLYSKCKSGNVFNTITGQKPITFKIPEDAITIALQCYVTNNATVENVVIYPQLELGDKETDFEPYKSQVLAITTPGGLPGIPMTSGGNYTDENGQQWLCDEVDLARGVYVQRVQGLTFDGTESWTLGDYNGTKYLLLPLSIPGVTSGAAGDMCTHATHTTWCAVSSLKGNDFFVSPHAFFSPSQGGNEYTNADDWKAYLAAQYEAGTPVEILYARATPAETALTDAEVQAFLALHSCKSNTTVLNDAGAHMVLEYAADPKTYIDNKLAALVAANN